MENSSKGSKVVKWVLIGVSFLFIAIMLILPLITVLTEAFKDGIKVFYQAVTDKYTVEVLLEFKQPGSWSTMVTVILFYAVIFVGFGLWIFWRFMSNDLYNEYILYGVMGGVCLTDFILLMFAYRKLTVITIIALVITFLFSLMVNTAFLARSESVRETIEDRRMAIDLWKDVVIDVAYAFLLILLLVIIKSTI